MKPIWPFLVNTPWWVYVLFFYLMFIGYRASKTHVVSLIKLCIIPAIFLFMSVHTLMTSFQINALSVGTYTGALVLGAVLGFYQIFRLALKVNHKKLLIQVPGSWNTIILIFIIFAAKYYFGYALAADPTLSKTTGFEVSMLIVSGIVSGMFVGRLLCFTYRWKTQPSVELTED